MIHSTNTILTTNLTDLISITHIWLNDEIKTQTVELCNIIKEILDIHMNINSVYISDIIHSYITKCYIVDFKINDLIFYNQKVYKFPTSCLSDIIIPPMWSGRPKINISIRDDNGKYYVADCITKHTIIVDFHKNIELNPKLDCKYFDCYDLFYIAPKPNREIESFKKEIKIE